MNQLTHRSFIQELIEILGSISNFDSHLHRLSSFRSPPWLKGFDTTLLILHPFNLNNLISIKNSKICIKLKNYFITIQALLLTKLALILVASSLLWWQPFPYYINKPHIFYYEMSKEQGHNKPLLLGETKGKMT